MKHRYFESDYTLVFTIPSVTFYRVTYGMYISFYIDNIEFLGKLVKVSDIKDVDTYLTLITNYSVETVIMIPFGTRVEVYIKTSEL